MSLTISVVTPSYNQAKFLEQTMLSVFGQSYPHIEYIVMDGGSDDGSADIIRRYAGRLAHWQSEKDAGQAAAISAGFEHATGDILCWLNSDDVFLPGALEKVAAFFEGHPEVETVTGGGYYIDADGRPARIGRVNFTLGVAASHGRFLHYLAQEGVLQQATFWRRSAYDAVGGVDPAYQFIMDFDLFTRLSARRPFAVLPEFLACFRMHGENKSLKLQATFRREYAQWERKHGLADLPTLWRRARFVAYHLQSLARKARLLALERVGRVRREPVIWPSEAKVL